VLTVIACPECEVPAEITDRFSLSSTDGPVDCVALSCVGGHHFRMPSELLSADSREQLEPQAPSPDLAASADRSRVTGVQRKLVP
jgi:hypothetical protein